MRKKVLQTSATKKAPAKKPPTGMRKPNTRLTAAQKRFIDEYFANGNNATKAYEAAYPGSKGAHASASKLLKDPKVAAEIAKRLAASSKRADVSRDKLVDELARLAFSTVGTFVRVDPDGRVNFDFSKMTETDWAAVESIQIERLTVSGRVIPENLREALESRGVKLGIEKTKVKLYDKGSSLINLAKMLGHYVEQRKHSFDFADDVMGDVGDDEIFELARQRLQGAKR